MRNPKVVIVVKTSKASSGHHNPYHTGGLAANALHTVGVLRRLGIDASLQTVKDFKDLAFFLYENQDITHCIIEAVWVTAPQMAMLSHAHPKMKLVVRAHSKIGFLQVEPEAIPVVRSLIWMNEEFPNVFFSSNNEEFCRALGEVYGETVYLPNLYDLEESPPHDPTDEDTLRIASFGATRLLKLHPNAALAALQIAHRMDLPLEFYINKDNTPGGESVRNTIKNLLADLPFVKLVEVDWQDAATFKETVSRMDLVIQLSCTETFCLVAADAVASGVPVVVGPAIAWLPGKYHANIDDTSEVAELGVKALSGSGVARGQQKALEKFVEDSQEVWTRFLEIPKKKGGLWWLF